MVVYELPGVSAVVIRYELAIKISLNILKVRDRRSGSAFLRRLMQHWFEFSDCGISILVILTLQSQTWEDGSSWNN